MQTHLSDISGDNGDKSHSSLPGMEGGRSLQVEFMPPSQIYAFKLARGRQRTLPASVDSQLPSVQNNPYAKVACVGWHILLFLRWK